jgi:hypothetical protein
MTLRRIEDQGEDEGPMQVLKRHHRAKAAAKPRSVNV